MQQARARSALALILRVDRRLYYRRSRRVVLFAQLLDLGLQRVQVAQSGVVDQFIDRLEGEGDGGWWVFWASRHLCRLFSLAPFFVGLSLFASPPTS